MTSARMLVRAARRMGELLGDLVVEGIALALAIGICEGALSLYEKWPAFVGGVAVLLTLLGCVGVRTIIRLRREPDRKLAGFEKASLGVLAGCGFVVGYRLAYL